MLHSVILAGGSGTRFWPASRRTLPKQLLAIGPDPASSLIASTVRRIAPLCPPERVLVATGEHLVSATQQALPGLAPEAFLGEPFARNTAPCIGWATARVRRRDPDAVVMVLPSDAHIADEPAYVAALARAIESAERGPITTIGVTPTRPETGYGYVEMGAELSSGVRRVLRFVEKPERARAEEYLATGRYAWNGGMFFFRASVMLAAIAEHLPELHAGLEAIERAALRGPEAEAAETRRVFESTASISIDYGVMERVKELAVVPASFGWSDLGSWESAWELAARDADDNAAPAGTVLCGARRNLVHDLRSDGRKRTIALVGVDDLCVIETDDALLIIPRERSQDVRLIVDELKRRGDVDLT